MVRLHLVVNLPGKNLGAARIALSHLANNLLGIGAKNRRGLAAMAANTQVRTLTVALTLHGLGMSGVEPQGRAVSRRTQNDLHTMSSNEVDGFVEPGKVVNALGRLHAAPRKLAHAHGVATKLGHAAHIVLPQGTIPMLRVVIDSNLDHAD